MPEFLHAWARWIDGELPADTRLAPLARPSWRSLAGHLFWVRTAAPPPAEREAPIVPEQEQVKTRAEFAGWLRYLGDECIDDHAEREKLRVRDHWHWEGTWAFGTELDSYLDGWRRCMADHGPGKFAAGSWRELADLVYFGKIYE